MRLNLNQGRATASPLVYDRGIGAAPIPNLNWLRRPVNRLTLRNIQREERHLAVSEHHGRRRQTQKRRQRPRARRH